MKRVALFAAFCLTLLPLGAMGSAAAYAETVETIEDIAPPPSKDELRAIKIQKKSKDEEDAGMPLQIRNDAMREAALSYGARGGLARRTFEIRQEMATRSRYLDQVFNFKELLIPAPSGLLIEPPVIGEAENAMLINKGGQEAAVADKVYNIGRNARIVSTARNWRAYLERQWGTIAPPPELLLPQNDEELEEWKIWFDEGWDAGVEQADEIFQADLNRLTADYQGMVRYRVLLSKGMVSPPYALQVDRGVTGGGSEMRVGDRAVTITDLPALQTDTQEWLPASR